MCAANGLNMQGLLYIEYTFHLTLMVEALIVAKGFYEMLRDKNVASYLLSGK